jgi:hydroxyacylglutathione hydrolase
MPNIQIEPIPCLKDNYAYLIHAGDGGDAVVVDPSEAAPVAEALARRHLRLRGILATHHHADHVGGIEALVAAEGDHRPWVAAHASDRGRVPAQSVFVDAPEERFVATELQLGGARVWAMHIPAHTRGAIAWGLVVGGDPHPSPIDVFTGDTLFGAGCGRLFEGTPADMFRSLRALTSGPDETRLWFGHEYTASNLRFAVTVEPDNAAIRARQEALTARTTPTTSGLERATNPFVRAATIDELAIRRAAKDTF